MFENLFNVMFKTCNYSDSVNEFDKDDSSARLYRVSGAGESVGLDVVLHIGIPDYFSFSKSFFGITVLLHDTNNFPQYSDKTAFAQPGTDVAVAIIPTVLSSEPSIRKLPFNKRNCYFEDEKKLRTTKKYSYAMCIAECTVDTILKFCQCLPFYFTEVRKLILNL